MSIPARALAAVRPRASSGVLASAAVVAAVFSATPLLPPDVSARLGVPVGLTGLLSTAQVGGFALASFLAGRLLRPRRRFHYAALGLVAIAAAASALITSFPLLVLSRAVSGLGMGTLTWIAWADATRFPHGFGEVAAVGPITATIVSPLLGWLIGWGGYPVVYGSLALVAAAALWFPVDFAYLPVVGRRVSDSRTNRLLLVAMFFLTTFGSAVFIFAGATAKALLGLSPLTVSLALSLNALTGVAATRFRARPRTAGAWLLGTAAGAYAVGTLPSITAFFLAMGLWGFAFWMGVPALFRLLAERSWTPSERVGDAQGMMALGRVFGPLIGGAAVGAGRYGRLSLVGALGLAFSSATVAAVEALRARR